MRPSSVKTFRLKLRDCSEFLVGGYPFLTRLPRRGDKYFAKVLTGVSIFYTKKKKKNMAKCPFRALLGGKSWNYNGAIHPVGKGSYEKREIGKKSKFTKKIILLILQKADIRSHCF